MYFCYFGHLKEWGDDYSWGEIIVIYQRVENVIFTRKQSSTLFVFYLDRTKKGFIFHCLYHSEVAAKPAKLLFLFSPSLYLCLWFGMWRPPALVAMRIDVRRRCALIWSPPYLPAVFSGLCSGAASQQDDPSCWPHTPEPCLVLAALEVCLPPVCENWTKSLVYVWKVDLPPTHFGKFSWL